MTTPTPLAATTHAPVADGVLEGGGVKGVALVETAIERCQAAQALEPCNLARSIRVDTTGARAIEFGLDAAQQERLLAQGRAAAEAFLARWDFADWLRTCGGVERISGTMDR